MCIDVSKETFNSINNKHQLIEKLEKAISKFIKLEPDCIELTGSYKKACVKLLQKCSIAVLSRLRL